MKVKYYRILLTICILLILFLLGQALYVSFFQTVYPTQLDKLYAITSFLWKYFMSILVGSLFNIPASELNKKMDHRTEGLAISILLILAFFIIRHAVLVNSNRINLVIWNFIYGHIFVSVVSVFLSVLILKFSYNKSIKLDKTDEI
jgi:hypothetical protein